MKEDEGSDETSDIYPHWIAAFSRLKNGFTEDEKYDNLMRWIISFCPTRHGAVNQKNREGGHLMTTELPHDKTNKVACAPSKESDQSGIRPV